MPRLILVTCFMWALVATTVACPLHDTALERLPEAVRILDTTAKSSVNGSNALTNMRNHWTCFPGDVVALVLRSNPTTGYSWQKPTTQDLISDASLVDYVGCVFQRHGGRRMAGAGGKEAWVFRINEEANHQATDTNVHVRLVYTKPWEQTATDPVTEFVLTVRPHT